MITPAALGTVSGLIAAVDAGLLVAEKFHQLLKRMDEEERDLTDEELAELDLERDMTHQKLQEAIERKRQRTETE